MSDGPMLFDEFAFVPARGLRRSSKVRRLSDRRKAPAAGIVVAAVPIELGTEPSRRRRRGDTPPAKAELNGRSAKTSRRARGKAAPEPAEQLRWAAEAHEPPAGAIVDDPAAAPSDGAAAPARREWRDRRHGRRIGAAVVAGAAVAAAAALFVLSSTQRSDEPAVKVQAETAIRSAAEHVGRPAEPTSFAYAFDPGESRSYSLEMSSRGGDDATAAEMSATLRLRIVKVAEDGSALAEITLDEIKTSPAAAVPETGRTTVRIGPDGRLTSAQSVGTPIGLVASSPDGAIAAVGAQFLFPQLPASAAAGDGWTKDSPVQTSDGRTVVVHTAGRLDGFSGAGPRRVAEIHQAAGAATSVAGGSTGDAGRIEWTTDALVVPATGEVKRMSGTIVQSTAAGTVTTKFTLAGSQAPSG